MHGQIRQKYGIGKWYFNGSGFAITLATENAYVGILIRFIAVVTREAKKPERTTAINGPLNAGPALFTQVITVITESPYEIGFVDITRNMKGASLQVAKVFALPGIALNDSKDNDANFAEVHIFITFLQLLCRESEKISC